MHVAHLSIPEALSSLQATHAGLDSAEAARRLREFGPNRIEAVKRTPLWWRCLAEFTHFFALILWLAAGLAFFSETRDPGNGMWQLGVAILAVILINGAFSFWQEYRAERAITALRKLLPQTVKLVRDGILQTLPAEALVPGDLILLAEGDRVPADCRLVEANGIRVDLSTVTGESQAMGRDAEDAVHEHAFDARNLLLAGTALVAGDGRAVVFATGMHTEFGKIAHLTQTIGEPGSPLQREIARLSKIIAVFALALGLAFFAIGVAIGLPYWSNLMFAIGIIVANVPEGLLPTVTLSLAMATQRMARRNALVRHLPAVETLGATTVICSDKTGTLTENRMAVQRVATPDGGSEPSPTLLATARYCHSLKLGRQDERETWLGDPMEIALVEFAGSGSSDPLSEIPFDGERRRMSVVIEADGEPRLYCKGAPESVLPLCDHFDEGEGQRQLDTAARARIAAAHEAMTDQGLRVLACAWRRLMPGEAASEHHLVFAGLIGLHDPPRAEVPEAIARCRAAGIKVIMVTGDNPHTALAIAREIGLVRGPHPRIVQGRQLRKMSSAQLQLALDAPEILFTRVTAEQKMLVVEALKRKGEIVAVTGDGVNDAPALKTAHIGIAMGQSGTDVAREAADMILLDDNFASIVNAVEEGRAVFENIRKFLTYILTSNVPELIPYLAFVLFRVPLPLTVIQILAVDLGTDMLPALALGAEPPHPGIMRQPPRPRHERLLTWPLLARAYLWLGGLQAAMALTLFFGVLHLGGWHYGELPDSSDPLYLQATTACLAAIVAAQVVNLFVCRHPREGAWRFGLAANPLLLPGLGVEIALLLLIVYTAAGNALFGTLPFEPIIWLAAALAALIFGALEEARKAIWRFASRRAPL